VTPARSWTRSWRAYRSISDLRLTHFGIKGALFYLAMAGTFLAAPYSNVFFLLFSFLTLQWLACAVWTHRNFRGVQAELGTIDPIPSGSAAAVRARVRASGRTRFRVVVELELLLADGQVLRVAGEVPTVDDVAEVQLRLPVLERGLYRVQNVRVRSSYPLGLFVARRSVEAPGELAVYPAPAELVTARSGQEGLSELLGGSASGPGQDQPSSLRDYREGDELRSIHWRATARRGALVVKEWEGGGGEGLELLLERRASRADLERALTLVSALIGLARTNKEVLRLHSQGLQATFGDGHRTWNEALRFLASAEVLPVDGPAPPPVPPSVTRLPQAVGHAR